MKKITAILSALCLLTMCTTSALPVFAETLPDSDVQTEEFDTVTVGDFVCKVYASHAEIVHCTSDAAEIVIPKNISGLPVTTIGDNAFSDCTALTAVVLPDSIDTLSQSAFAGTSLKKLYLEDDDPLYSGIGDAIPHDTIVFPYFHSYAETGESTTGFSGGMSYRKFNDHVQIVSIDHTLTEVVIPAELEGLPVTGFSGLVIKGLVGGTPANWSLEKITIPETVTDFSLAHCAALQEIILEGDNPAYTTVDGVLFNKDATVLRQFPLGREDKNYTVPDTVKEIGDYAFSKSKLQDVILPEGLTNIGYSAFGECESLQSIDIPDSVNSIGTLAFTRCYAMTSAKLPEGLTEIPSHMFRFTSALSEVNFPESLTKIGEAAFYGTALTEAILPPQVAVLEANVFTGCTELTRVKIPAATTEIGDYAFSGCTAMTGIFVDKDNAVYSDCSGVLMDKAQTTILDYPDSYPAKRYTIPATVTTIKGQAFSEAVTLEAIIIPDTVKTIGSHAFLDCTNLRSAVILADTDKIGQYTFYNCGQLSEITLTNRIQSVGFRAFTEQSEQTDVYYLGTEEEWAGIVFEGVQNEGLTEGNVHFNQTYILLHKGDLTGDDRINSSDAAVLLLAAANEGVTGVSELTQEQLRAADLNNDGSSNAADAAMMLHYAAYRGTGGVADIEEFFETK